MRSSSFKTTRIHTYPSMSFLLYILAAHIASIPMYKSGMLFAACGSLLLLLKLQKIIPQAARELVKKAKIRTTLDTPADQLITRTDKHRKEKPKM